MIHQQPNVDFSDWELRDLFKVRDALAILARYELHNEKMYDEVREELKKWGD